MVNHQLYPLEVSPRGEPFLRLRKHKNIIITPVREEDIALYIPIMNDPRIYEMLGTTPFPYLLEHAEAWYSGCKKASDEILAHLEEAKESPESVLVSGCPVRAIRKVNEEGEEEYLGDIGITRLQNGRLLAPPLAPLDEEHLAKYVAENVALSLGDPEIVWTVGDYIVPNHHGKGIMSDVLDTVLWDWAVPRMGVRQIVSSAFEGNPGSLRVFEKNGFVWKRLIEKHVETRGRWRNLNVMEWNWSTANPL